MRISVVSKQRHYLIYLKVSVSYVDIRRKHKSEGRERGGGRDRGVKRRGRGRGVTPVTMMLNFLSFDLIR